MQSAIVVSVYSPYIEFSLCPNNHLPLNNVHFFPAVKEAIHNIPAFIVGTSIAATLLVGLKVGFIVGWIAKTLTVKRKHPSNAVTLTSSSMSKNTVLSPEYEEIGPKTRDIKSSCNVAYGVSKF